MKAFGDMDVEDFKQKTICSSEQSDVDAVRSRFETFDDWFFKEPYRAKYRSVYDKSNPVYMSAKEAWDYQAGIAAREGWISVEDRLPDTGKVLIYCPEYANGDVMQIRIIDAQFISVCSEATHWMPLPEAPIEE